MEDKWYFGWDDQRFGPLTESQLMELAGRGRIQPTDIIWKEGIAKGIIAEKVRNLFRSPRAEPDPTETNEPVAAPPSVGERPALGNSRSVPGTAAKYTEWLALNNQPKAAGMPNEMPDELTLKSISGQND